MSRLTRLAIPAVILLAAGACALMWPRGKGEPAAAAPHAATAPSPATSPATAQSGAPLSVTIADLRNKKGVLIFGVFNQADGFPNKEKKSVYWEVRDANTTNLTFTCRLPPGKYAASVLHDENRSGEMDRGIGGLPLEGYGVTNNPKPRLRAATFNEATFDLPPEGKELTISVQYQFL
jgi:uncharacterized protein (DUF2141 family)